MSFSFPCPCFSGEIYEKCCAPFHRGAIPENALQLMRSRYSAYALDLPDYIIATTHPKNPGKSKDPEPISEFSRRSQFVNLEILDFQNFGNRATVTFRATIFQNGKDASFTEKSLFEKVRKKWFYLAALELA